MQLLAKLAESSAIRRPSVRSYRIARSYIGIHIVLFAASF